MADEVLSRFRDPPGWAAAIMRVAQASFSPAMSADVIRSRFQRLSLIVVEELPDSDERQRLLARLCDLETAALRSMGELTVH
jgi:hypothetical protein